ncbi:uncharacterized protein LY89DRAFT_788437 [Mollisia scopiformis]|uniref:Uncharacterized protein n=1 Tax=Mollisia scopiformis TaxID=149040 RepID=A0A132B9E0_MOLSC|nr:uncharacterized protein LY89DRAFT_788437 [Mollisia scopiformis]KUJ09022.1 hypothetical protein LY89DRAFT_788437 [Mollisia scopiformis]
MSHFEETVVHHVRPIGWQNDPDQEIWILSDLEYMMPQVFLKFSFLYKIGEGVDEIAVIDGLKESLALTLSQYRPLTGVFKKDDGEVKIFRNRGDTVSFVVKRLYQNEKSVSLADLEAAGFPPLQVDRQVALENMGDASIDSMIKNNRIQTELQATWLQDGIILTIGYHHYCTDGAGFSKFVQQWARNSLALSKNTKPEPPAWDYVNLDRGRLNGKFVPPEKRIIPQPPNLSPTLVTVPFAQAPPQRPVILHFHKSSTDLLKRIASSSGGTFVQISSYDAITALLWRAYTRARLTIYDLIPDESTMLGQVVDLRSRFDPPLDSQLQANATLGVVTPGVSIHDVVADGKLGFLASLVRQAHIGATEEVALERSNMVAMLQDKTMAAWSGERVPRFGVAMSDMRSSKFYEADFGFGPPVAVRNVHQPGYPCVIQKLAPQSDQETMLEVQIPVDVSCFECFIQDPELLLYAEIVSG